MIYNLLIINKFLINYHRKLKLYNFSKYSYYLTYLLLKLYNFNNKYVRSINIDNFKINYIKYIYKEHIYSYNLKNNIFQYIIIENNINYNININVIINTYFINKLSIKIYLPINFTLKINIWHYVLYNTYIIYLAKYIYNLLVRINESNIKNPLLLLVTRYIYLNRLDKIIDKNKNRYSNNYFNIKYKIINKNNKLFKILMIQNVNNFKLIYKDKIIKLFIILSNNELFKSLNFIWCKSSKINLLYNNYSNIVYNTVLVEINKFNVLGLYSLYWQILRYGFNYEYYYYNISLLNIIVNNKSNIKLYNNLYFSYILLSKKKIYLIMWYKIKNIIIINYINKNFYKYNKKFKLNKYNKNFYYIYLTRIISNYVFKFNPVNIKIYYNIKFIKYYISLVKKNLDYICNTFLFTTKYNKLYRNNISILNIIDIVNLDIKINTNFYIYKNIYYFILRKLIEKYHYMNLFNVVINIKNFKLKSIGKSKTKKNDIKIFNDYQSIKNRGIIKYKQFIKLYNSKYIWVFENSIIYYLYIIFINIYYKLLILINMEKYRKL